MSHTRVGFVCFSFVFCSLQLIAACGPPPKPAPVAAPVIDSLGRERLRLAKEVLASIKGQENDPAGKVFTNVTRLTQVPAKQLLAIMVTGYAKSLGVSCSHCHVVGEWESDDKPQKQIARDMAAMSARINKELLPAIKNLKGPNPVVNCTTCHRGHVKPALDIE